MATATAAKTATPAPAPAPANNNMAIWNANQMTNPAYTKQFTRGGGFKGTAINATYMAKCATEQFGPIGTGWGVEVVSEEIMQGAPYLNEGVVVCHQLIHKLLVRVWYMLDGKRGEVCQFGQTEFLGKRATGFFTDEEAPKKSLTDGMTKALSLLGFASDVHLGLYDDNKYVNDVTKAFAATPKAGTPEAPVAPPKPATPAQPPANDAGPATVATPPATPPLDGTQAPEVSKVNAIVTKLKGAKTVDEFNVIRLEAVALYKTIKDTNKVLAHHLSTEMIKAKTRVETPSDFPGDQPNIRKGGDRVDPGDPSQQ